jgi:predicted MFS family arabinose efflux permease
LRYKAIVTPRRSTGVFVLAAGISGWNCGNVGPVVGSLAHDFDLSLSEIGLLSGTFFFAGCVVASLVGARVARRTPVLWGIWACCVLSALGNVIIAAGDSFAVLAVGRVIAGIGVGLSVLFIPAYARAMGGVRLLGVFGAGLTLGIAVALWIGSLLEGGGVDWRVSFVITAALAVVALPLLPNETVDIKRAPLTEGQGLVGEALTNQAWWRVEVLGITTLTIPLVIGAWLVHYLITEIGLSAAAAGGLSFLLFGISAVMRDVAGRLAGSGTSPSLMAVGGLGLAAAGIAVLGLGTSAGTAAAGIVLIGVGLSLPYPLFYDQGERVLPDRPVAGLAALQVGVNAFPILVVPLFGAALAGGNSDAAFLALAGFTLFTTLLNVRPAVPAAASPASAAPG